ncbi:hypothetical protein [Brevundimonas sp.]|uniref:hypothetical protein n=1 Tax=Brevundimonas sp. TaxID=1871086 RepID=UPI0035AF2335
MTGSAGIIGLRLSRFLLKVGRQVFGVDTFSDGCDVGLKQGRTEIPRGHPGCAGFSFELFALEDAATVSARVQGFFGRFRQWQAF